MKEQIKSTYKLLSSISWYIDIIALFKEIYKADSEWGIIVKYGVTKNERTRYITQKSKKVIQGTSEGCPKKQKNIV